MILQPIHIIYKACYLRVHKKCKYIFLFTGCLDRKNKQEKVKRKKYMFGSKKKKWCILVPKFISSLMHDEMRRKRETFV